jgi:hypothetical protein
MMHPADRGGTGATAVESGLIGLVTCVFSSKMDPGQAELARIAMPPGHDPMMNLVQREHAQLSPPTVGISFYRHPRVKPKTTGESE